LISARGIARHDDGTLAAVTGDGGRLAGATTGTRPATPGSTTDVKYCHRQRHRGAHRLEHRPGELTCADPSRTSGLPGVAGQCPVLLANQDLNNAVSTAPPAHHAAPGTSTGLAAPKAVPSAVTSAPR
jgi:hypothetical protein